MLQEVNPLFELFFLAVLLTSLGVAVAAIVALIRRRWPTALHRAKLLLLIDSAYLALVVCVSLLLPFHVLSPGDLECFDDWCITARNVEYRSSLGGHRPQGEFALVQLDVVSRARRVSQSEKLAKAEVGDERGNWYEPSAVAQRYVNEAMGVQPALAQRLDPGRTFSTVLAFDVPRNTRQIALRMNHSGGPGCLIIGESHLLRPGTEFHFRRAPNPLDAR